MRGEERERGERGIRSAFFQTGGGRRSAERNIVYSYCLQCKDFKDQLWKSLKRRNRSRTLCSNGIYSRVPNARYSASLRHTRYQAAFSQMYLNNVCTSSRWIRSHISCGRAQVTAVQLHTVNQVFSHSKSCFNTCVICIIQNKQRALVCSNIFTGGCQVGSTKSRTQCQPRVVAVYLRCTMKWHFYSPITHTIVSTSHTHCHVAV